MKKIKRAIDHYNQALQVFTHEDHPRDWGMIQNGLGEAYRSLSYSENRAQNLRQAINHFREALKVRSYEFSPQEWAATQNNLGNAYREYAQIESTVSFEQAIDCFKQSLRVYTFEAVPQNHITTLVSLGLTYQDAKYYQFAYDTLKKAINTIESLRGKIFSGDESKKKLAEKYVQIYQRMVEFCLKLDNLPEAVEYLERSKTRNLLEMMGIQVSHQISFEKIQSLLKDNTLIVEWYIGTGSLQAFLISTHPQQPIQVWQSFRNNLEILEGIGDYLQKVYGTEKNLWQEKLPNLLKQLAELLHFNELMAMIRENHPQCEHLILIPHWVLHLLPLHALPLADGQCLLDKFATVRYVPSCQILHQVQARKRQESKMLLAVQNPASNLPFADIEVGAIRRKFKPHDTVLVGELATKMAVMQAPLSQAHCIHFACHGRGMFDPKFPLEPALHLANKESLTLGDIFGLHLTHCHLVTLSACETGQIDFTNTSDEYIGLPAGFLYAGATVVVSSLWAVSDISTSLLMIKFYQEIQAGEPISASIITHALNKAQVWLRNVTKSELLNWSEKNLVETACEKVKEELDFRNPEDSPYRDAYFWAGFYVAG